MSSEVSAEEVQTEVIFENIKDESSEEEPPMEEWSSLIVCRVEENPKKILYEEGLYHPGSGEICAKYIAMSQSSVLRHPYYFYPAVIDPGIKGALLHPEPIVTYPDDGQDLYLVLCKEMNQCPVMSFHRGLLTSSIDLRYYCVNPFGVRAMALALQYNRHVTSLNLTDNFLNDDACFHLGEMLISNATLEELNLSGCRIGPSGAKKLLAGLTLNKKLRNLNLNKNELGDAGLEHLADAVFKGIDIKKISLSKNNITNLSLITLAEAFETHNHFTHVDLSRNTFFSPTTGITKVLARMSENKGLQYLDLSWNALSGKRLAGVIKLVLRFTDIQFLNLSNNRFSSDSSRGLSENLARAKKLATFDVSYNPFKPVDALKFLDKLKTKTCKIKRLLMENVLVDQEFLTVLDQIKEKKAVEVTYGGVVYDFKAQDPDIRHIVLNRAEFLAKKPKKKTDIALIVLQVYKDNGMKQIIDAKTLQYAFRKEGAPLDNDLVEELINAFIGPKGGKNKMLNIKDLVDFLKRKWPERKLPPTPPPEPEPEPPKKGKGKGKGKKK